MDILLMSSGRKTVRRLINLFGRSSIVEIWPLNETSGSVAYGAVNGYNGAYTGVDLANAASRVPGQMCPYFDGVNDQIDIFSAGLAAAFNPSAFTTGGVVKVANAGVWADGVYRSWLTLRVDAANFLHHYKDAATGRCYESYRATTDVYPGGAANFSLDFYNIAATFDGTRGRHYESGVNVSASPLLPGVWASTITSAFIGATSRWHGYISYVYLLNRVATDAEIASANRILGGA
jgi:hypothetical protein